LRFSRARSLRVAVIGFVVIIIILFIILFSVVVFLFVFFLVWLLSQEDIGGNPATPESWSTRCRSSRQA
jgi:hypothetical protein